MITQRPKRQISQSTQGKILKKHLGQISQDEIDQISHPLDILQILLEKGLIAVLEIIKATFSFHCVRRVPTGVKEAVLKRDKYRCVLCKEDDPDLLEIHHVARFADGGEHKTNNLVTLCKHCHEKVGRGKKRVRKPRAICGVD